MYKGVKSNLISPNILSRQLSSNISSFKAQVRKKNLGENSLQVTSYKSVKELRPSMHQRKNPSKLSAGFQVTQRSESDMPWLTTVSDLAAASASGSVTVSAKDSAQRSGNLASASTYTLASKSRFNTRLNTANDKSNSRERRNIGFKASEKRKAIIKLKG